jgi:hypothetical protein
MSDYMSAIKEIERLNAELDRLKEENAHLASRDKDKNKIIAELASALFAYWDNPYSNGGTSGDNETLELIQSARRATE